MSDVGAVNVLKYQVADRNELSGRGAQYVPCRLREEIGTMT